MQNKYSLTNPRLPMTNSSNPLLTSARSGTDTTTPSDKSNEPKIQSLSVEKIHFSQHSVSEYFTDGRALAQVVKDLICQKVSLDQIPPIRVVSYNKRWVTLDNRRLRVFKDAGVTSITVSICDLSDPHIKREFFLKKTHKAIEEGGEIRQSSSRAQGENRDHFDQGAFIFTKKVLSWNLTQIQTPFAQVQVREALSDRFNDDEENYYQQFLDLILEEARAVLHQALDLIEKEKTPPVAIRLIRTKLAKNFSNPSLLYFELPKNMSSHKNTLKNSDIVLLKSGTLSLTGMISYLNPEETDKQIVLKAVVDQDMRTQHSASFERDKIEQPWQLYPMESLITTLRMYEACTTKKSFSFITQVMTGNFNLPIQETSLLSAFSINSMHPSFNTLSLAQPVESPLLQKLNTSQAKAVKEFLDLEQGIKLIQGPPGTGKTTTLITLLEIASQNSRRILVCAPSNKAVQILAERFLEKCPDVSSILVGVEDKLPDKPTLKSIFIHTWKAQIQSEISALFELAQKLKTPLVLPETEDEAEDNEPLIFPMLSQKERQLLVKTANALQDKFNHLVIRLKRFELAFLIQWMTESMKFFPALQYYVNNLAINNPNTLTLSAEWIQTQLELLSILFGALSNLGLILGAQEDELVESALLNAVKVIFATLSVTGRKAFRELQAVDSLIVDEAGQAVEAETLIALQTNPKKCLLVGDTKQLPATVISKLAGKLKFDRSLLWRLLEDCKQPYALLQEQYRMLPEISAWPSNQYYERQLINAPQVTDPAHSLEKMKNAPAFLGPYAFIDVDGREGFLGQEGKSLWNAEEQYVVVGLVRHLAMRYKIDVEKQVGIITFYKAQVEKLSEKLHRDYPKLTIQTVDGFQGGENDITIISFVRANSKGNIGFLSDFRRLNVGITRARFALLMVGHSETLLNNEKDVAALIQDAKAREKHFSYESIKSELQKKPNIKHIKSSSSTDHHKHPSKAPQKTIPAYNQNRCYFFNGAPDSCTRGEKCTFSHGKQPTPKNESLPSNQSQTTPLSTSHQQTPKFDTHRSNKNESKKRQHHKPNHRENTFKPKQKLPENDVLSNESINYPETLPASSHATQKPTHHKPKNTHQTKWREKSALKAESSISTTPYPQNLFVPNTPLFPPSNSISTTNISSTTEERSTEQSYESCSPTTH